MKEQNQNQTINQNQNQLEIAEEVATEEEEAIIVAATAVILTTTTTIDVIISKEDGLQISLSLSTILLFALSFKRSLVASKMAVEIFFISAMVGDL